MIEVEFEDLVRLRDYPGERGTVDTIFYRDNKPSMIWFRNESRDGHLDWSNAKYFELYRNGKWVDIVSEEDRPANVKVEIGDLVRLRDHPEERGVVNTTWQCDDNHSSTPDKIWFINEKYGWREASSAKDFELYRNGKWVDIVNRDFDFEHPKEVNPRINVAYNIKPKNPADDWVSLTGVTATLDVSPKEYPHTCTHCGAPSYNGLNRVDCSAGCNER